MTSEATDQTPKLSIDDNSEQLQRNFESVLSVGEECISPDELRSLMKFCLEADGGGKRFNCYDGFEPSGRMHIAQGVFKAMNVNKITNSGGTFTFWVADWFALMNDKMGGDLAKIKVVGKYLIEVWRAAGMEGTDGLEGKVVFKWASDEICDNAATYWPMMLDIARRFNVTRIKKCCQIMGRLEGSLTAAQVLYPLMQCTDVFFLKADVCQLGVDQRKVNMLAREYCDAAKRKRKPIILSHHMLYGLKAGQEKMSKSDPDSAIFMEDSADDVERKIRNAYCPNVPVAVSKKDNEDDDAGKESMHLLVDDLKNPCLDYVEHIVLCPPGSSFAAAGKTFDNFAEVRAAFIRGLISEDQLKDGLIASLNKLLEPVRKHFMEDDNAKTLLEQVRHFKKESTGAVIRTFRRLDCEAAGFFRAGCHVVFLPRPDPNPTLQSTLDVLSQIRAAPEDANGTVLYLSDWSATVTNACAADPKAMAASFTVMLTALRAIAPEVMKQVTVVKQSEAILKDPSNYWISVINVGRLFSLDTVQADNKDADGVGVIIARLMGVADAMACSPSSIAFSASDKSGKIAVNLIQKYFAEASVPLPMPTILEISVVDLSLHTRTEVAHITENDAYFLLDDPNVHGKSKMKKAFCEPGNVIYCPPIALACAFQMDLAGKSVNISRSEENGGNVSYQMKEEVERDFELGALHPGDLKSCATKIIVEVIGNISKAIKADKASAQAAKSLKAFIKKQNKSKK
eukprot:CAMPEP_0113307914 /NCGR_PEP_ID=MMETSP0010_2-20120614/6567_1 /TAXON_ID=216773 ORGANISM="Corethron hystrix, Strain 308" /NCGR_SAMPLE_ID=MMETSP0010_2 /ASSEMBLY_ACC=CAM_ASM_000155 /LENGTH=739 /DNA_ID=CAMNT_0000162861 /DNA_START=55 /DNA_END=2274 /DNA_ORIENTATION=- /assembly_acc=CAM_ASM_000155